MKYAHLIPAGITLALIGALIGWDIYQTIRNTPPRRDKR